MEEYIVNPSFRAGAREYAFALLFARTFAPDEEPDAFWRGELENAEVEFGDQIDYVHGVFFGTADRLSEIDGLIADAAQGWTIARLSKVTVSIMRLAIYEMLAVEDVPKRVALNEAVELAKKYDEDSAPAFINGVLNTISHKLSDKECDK